MMASICSFERSVPKCGMRPDEMPRTPYCLFASTPSAIHVYCSVIPSGPGNWSTTAPFVRFGPNAPVPCADGSGTPPLVGSKYDQPLVWQGAQLAWNSRFPYAICAGLFCTFGSPDFHVVTSCWVCCALTCEFLIAACAFVMSSRSSWTAVCRSLSVGFFASAASSWASCCCALARLSCAVFTLDCAVLIMLLRSLCSCCCAFAGDSWMLCRYAMRSSTLCVFFDPPPATPHAGIGVPGRPYVMIWFTCAGVYRSSTVFSAGARHVTWTGWLLPLAGGCRTYVVDPPLASVPWQSAQRSDCVGSYAFIVSFANRVAPRSTAALSNPATAFDSRVGSHSQ